MKRISMLMVPLIALLIAFAIPVLPPVHGAGHDSDIVAHKSCQYCGMDRGKFSHSRMVLEFDNGTKVATCSLHCAAVDLATRIDLAPTSIKVADYDTKMLIDGEKGFWVIGGSKMGVMTKNAKWAFASAEQAKAFIAANGGTAATFDVAVRTAYEDMYSDTKMIRDKRKQMRMLQKK